MRLPEREILRELERQFRDLVYLEDEEGYWKWISEQPGFDPDDERGGAWLRTLGAKLFPRGNEGGAGRELLSRFL